MEIRGAGLIIGTIGFIMISSSLMKAGITGAVVGTNSNSKSLGFLGILLIILAIFVEKYELKKHSKKLKK